MKLKFSILVFAVGSLAACFSHAQTTLSVGDIGITGFNSNTPDGFTFVLYKSVAAGTLIKFTDNGFLSTASATAAGNGRGGENFVSWTAPTGGLSAGSVVRIVNVTASTNTVTGGGTTTLGLNGISASGDQIFVYQGAGTGASAITSDFGSNANPSTFTGTALFGLNFQSSWLATGTAISNTSYLPSTLNAANANLELSGGTTTSGQYTGVRTGLSSTLYSHAVSNASNWTTGTSGNETLSTNIFTIATAASIHWDANGVTSGDGGAGTWDSTTNDRFKDSAAGTTRFRWVNSSTGNDHTAVFGGTSGTVILASSGVSASGLTFDVSGFTIESNTLTLAGSTPTISVTTAAHSATISSTIAGSSGLTKSGAGTLTLSGTNNYTGTTTVEAGTLIINGNISTSLTTIKSGGTLGGSGYVGGLSVEGGGTLAPGNSPGILNVGSTSLATLSTFAVEINGNTVSTQYDQLNVTGTLSLAGLLSVTMGYTPADSALFFIIANDGLPTDAITGTFSNAPVDGGIYKLGGQDFKISYFGDSVTNSFIGGNDVVLMAIPEPSATLLVGGLGFLVMLRRRR